MRNVACGDRVIYSWPFRWTIPFPVFHFMQSNPLLTECGKVISGPSWVTMRDWEMPDCALMCGDCFRSTD